MSWAYWNGGAAVSNYHSTIADGTSNTQLSIPADLAAHSGSNFLMIYGSIDGYNAPILDFKDGKAHTMKGLWITNGTYFLNVMANGNDFCAKAKSSTQISLYVNIKRCKTHGKRSSRKNVSDHDACRNKTLTAASCHM